MTLEHRHDTIVRALAYYNLTHVYLTLIPRLDADLVKNPKKIKEASKKFLADAKANLPFFELYVAELKQSSRGTLRGGLVSPCVWVGPLPSRVSVRVIPILCRD